MFSYSNSIAMRFLFAFALFILASTSLLAQGRYHKARVHYNSTKDLFLLTNQGVAIDHGIHKKGVYIESDFSDNEISIAKQLGLQVEIIVEDVDEFYSNQNEVKSTEKNSSCFSKFDYPVPNNYKQGSMGGFLTYSEMLAELDLMAQLYPNLISTKAPISTFLTEENRPIYWVKISDNPNQAEAEPEMLYTAIHHAREPASLQQTIYYMWFLLENYSSDNEVKAIVDNTQLLFVPCMNPDGYIRNETTNPNGGGLWRKNRKNNNNGTFGVDLNRNYSYQWGGDGSSSNTSSEIYRGTSAFSEKETLAIKWLCEQHDFKIALNSHAYGNLLLYPFGYALNQVSPDDVLFKSISGLMVEQNNYVNQISSDLYAAAGDSDDWMYAETSTHNEILAMTPEVGRSFWPSQSEILPICKEMVHHNFMAAKLILNYGNTIDISPSYINDLSGHLHYSIEQLGMSNPGNFTVSLEPLSANITSVGGANNHTNLSLQQIDIDSFAYNLDPNINFSDEIKFVLKTNNGLYTHSDTIIKHFGVFSPVFNDNSNDLSNWSTNGNWNTTASQYYSSPNSITDSPQGNYRPNSNSHIETLNNVSLSNAISAKVSFFARWDIEENFDFVQFEISTDNGESWSPQCGKYTTKGTSNQRLTEPVYDGMQNAWVKEEIDLSNYIGENISARFTLISDGAVEEDGFYFDEFNIDVIKTSNIEEFENSPFSLSKSFPNPANTSATILYNSKAQNNTFVLTNQLGEIVFSEHLNQQGKIMLETSQFPSGIYYYYIKSANTKSHSEKLVVVHN